MIPVLASSQGRKRTGNRFRRTPLALSSAYFLLNLLLASADQTLQNQLAQSTNASLSKPQYLTANARDGRRIYSSQKIRPSPCRSNSNGHRGVCMFVWECVKKGGSAVGICTDRFMFGGCCHIPATMTASASTAAASSPDDGGWTSLLEAAASSSQPWGTSHMAGPGNPHTTQSPSSLPATFPIRPSPDTLYPYPDRPPHTFRPASHLDRPSTYTGRPWSYLDDSSLGGHRPSVYEERPAVYPNTIIYDDRPSSIMDSSSTYLNVASTLPHLPSTYPDRLSAYPDRPFTLYDKFSTQYDRPSFSYSDRPTYPDRPSTYPDRPSTYSDQHSTHLIKPSSFYDRPSAIGDEWPSSSSSTTTSRPGVTVPPSSRWPGVLSLVTGGAERPIVISHEIAEHENEIPSGPVAGTKPRPPQWVHVQGQLPDVSTPWPRPTRPTRPGRPGPASSTVLATTSTTTSTTTTPITTTTTRPTTLTTRRPVATAPSQTQTGPGSGVNGNARAAECGVPPLFARSGEAPETRVVGGKNAPFGGFPWQVSVRRTSFFGLTTTHRCGGALLNEQWVATAGHCVDDLLLSQIRIRVGEYDFGSVMEPYPYQERTAVKKIVHPKYNFYSFEYDLALVKLAKPVELTLNVHPICLPGNDDLMIGENATVTGWGRLSEGGTLPSILQQATVPIMENSKCKQLFKKAGRKEYIPEIFLCAGFEKGGTDSCQGDSGGPLQVRGRDGRWFLAGIISWGIGCAEPNLPGVCTRISKFTDWVVEKVSST